MINHCCNICPRKCGADRVKAFGFCGAGREPEVALYMLHHFEEPFISGLPDDKRGSGTVFFRGCSLGCVYCQNHKISYSQKLHSSHSTLHTRELDKIFLKLQEQGAYNINLVTPTHFTIPIIEAVRAARKEGLTVPVIWNTSGYELAETVELLKDTVDIYLTDFKYYKREPAQRYSGAPDYFEAASAALDVMVSQRPELKYDESGMLKSGVVVRQLALPGLLSDSCRILEYIYNRYGDRIFISIMNQYTPQKACDFTKYPELQDKTPQRQYNKLVKFARELGITNAFIQSGAAISESFTPEFT